MDYRVYHAINDFVYHHSWLGRDLNDIEAWSVPVLAVATVALWLLARPGGQRKWKLASACALASAGLALLVNQFISKVIWDRPRPFAAHPDAHVWGSRSHDPSFPSDHSAAAFAIAFTVLFFDRLVGSLFLVAAAAEARAAARDATRSPSNEAPESPFKATPPRAGRATTCPCGCGALSPR